MYLQVRRDFDIIVIGGGHAGSEAAHATAKLGLKTLLLTLNINQIASMPCNPAVGGPAKSHLVKEIDALGGLMGLAADATYIQLKTLNMSKGPAVQALRAQSDKLEYSNWVRQYLEQLANLTIYQSGAKSLIFDKAGERVIGLQTQLDEEIYAKAIVLTAGTFLEGRIFSGEKFESAGRAGEQASHGLSDTITSLGLNKGRLKTGTPPRLDKTTIDFSKLELAPGDDNPNFFSFLPHRPVRRQYPCHITRTNEQTHEIINKNLHKSPMYSGMIDAVGPRYCPSIEDKVVKFPHNPSHHFFLEPEGLTTKEVYLQGCSTSLPVEVQWQIVRSLPGCENADIMRPAYAVEYDYFPGTQFNHSLECKNISALFVAGQVLGTSGYEEAAAQGLVAGLNAAIKVANENPELVSNKELKEYIATNDSIVFERSESYIGTLIDDLVTKELAEPYRMLTSRSEYRLVLRQDNADKRMTTIGRKLGLVDDYRWQHFNDKQERINKEIKYFNNVRVDLAQIEDCSMASQEQKEKITTAQNSGKNNESKLLLADLLKRPELDSTDLAEIIHCGVSEKDISRLKEKNIFIDTVKYPFELATEIKYAGYINRQMQQIKDLERYEKIKIPEGFDFENFPQIRLESREKLNRIKPKNLGQASRIGGITPNDISIISIAIEAQKRKLSKV